MTYDEWRESYHPEPLMNEGMARSAWDAAVKDEREACAQHPHPGCLAVSLASIRLIDTRLVCCAGKLKPSAQGVKYDHRDTTL